MIRITIQAGKGKTDSLGIRFRTGLKEFLNKPIDRSTVRRLRVTGRDQNTGGLLPAVDLLLKQFMFAVRVQRPEVDSDLAVDCFRAIEELYGRNSAELIKAATLDMDEHEP